MSAPPLVDDAGRPVRFGRELGRGKAGVVYAVEGDSAVVAKLLHPPERTPDNEARLRALVALTTPKLLAVAAWPRRLLSDARGRAFAGFTMENLSGYREMWELYNPVQRLESFPRAGWDFQVRAATNLAAAFEEVHAAGVVVGDVSLRNEVVSPQALVRLIDADSFQVRAGGRLFTPDLGTPLYIPPELVGKPLRGLARTPNHDRFGLAVLAYQLLFVGRHPYAGVYSGPEEPDPDFLISNYKFAQGPAARTWGMAPPPHTPTLADLPPAVGDLFRRAFERGGEADARPRPADWVAALRGLERELAGCPADPGHKSWRGAGGCAWCRIARAGGPEYYFGVADGDGRFAVDEARLSEVLRRLAAVPADPFPYRRAAFAPAARPAGRALPAALAGLFAARQAAAATRRAVAGRRRVADDQVRQRADEAERQAVADAEAAFRRRDAELTDEEVSVRAVARTETQRGRVATSVLGAALVLGVVLVGLGCLHKGFLLAGGMTACVAGVLLADHLMRAPAAVARRALNDLCRQRQAARVQADRRTRAARARTQQAAADAIAASREAIRPHDVAARTAERAYERASAAELAARRLAAADAESALHTLEAEWAEVADAHSRRHADAARAADRLAADGRGLAAVYAADLAKLTAGAAAAARGRHLRLHLLADAVIPNVGAGRKQALAAAGVLTAADVTPDAVRGVKGFGDNLTAAVLAWRVEVERAFHFNPLTAVPPAPLRELTARCLARQQQVLAELGRLAADLEASAAAGRRATDALTLRVRAAVAAHEQARADLLAAGG